MFGGDISSFLGLRGFDDSPFIFKYSERPKSTSGWQSKDIHTLEAWQLYSIENFGTRVSVKPPLTNTHFYTGNATTY